MLIPRSSAATRIHRVCRVTPGVLVTLCHKALYAAADGLGGRAVPEELAEQRRQPTRRERDVRRGLQLPERPPPQLRDAFVAKLLGRQTRADREGRGAKEVEALGLTVPPAHREHVGPHPDACAERPREVETQLLAELAPERRGVVLAFLGASAGCSPEAPRGELEADEDDPLVRVDDERPDAGPEPHGTSSRRARNHRSRSSQETAAFAGDVDGRT